ncbi:hypothetical protein [Roseovarius arcticus]|nr:hypothetical protein [Roseovarius arcticus]
MRAFLLALVALAAITVGVNLILAASDFSAKAAWASPGNVRIDN